MVLPMEAGVLEQVQVNRLQRAIRQTGKIEMLLHRSPGFPFQTVLRPSPFNVSPFHLFPTFPFGQVTLHQPPLLDHLRQIFDRPIHASFPLINEGYSAKIIFMKKKILMETNRYLKDPAEREAGIVLNVATSSAIEGIPLSAFGSFVTTRKNQSGKAVSASARSARSLPSG